jgi:hypothetical protein
MWVNGNRKNGYSSLLISGVILLAISQALESIPGGAVGFVRGVLIGLSIVCCLAGLYLYARRPA